jgi:L-lactate dehydrogenase complex protein LldG
VVSGLVATFIDACRANSSLVTGPVSHAEVPATVTGIVRDAAAGGTVALASGDPALRDLAILDALRGAGCDVVTPGDTGWSNRLPAATAGVTGALIGVAEQGVVALAAGRDAPRATSLLPPTHICVVFADTLLATFAAAIDAVTAMPLPSALTWIGGPSRTGDLEMVQTLGVHGPKTVHLVVVEH